MGGIIDGPRWVADRLGHLEERLQATENQEQRRSIEAEIAALRTEGRRHAHKLRWLSRPFLRREL